VKDPWSDRPRLEGAVELPPEIVMQPRGGVNAATTNAWLVGRERQPCLTALPSQAEVGPWRDKWCETVPFSLLRLAYIRGRVPFFSRSQILCFLAVGE